ncbi:MAG: hypothetical protein COB17_01920 [Sulfurimonas sp.]|nr:MAG: hypothetical protein COB17_01920 [Sulfurimonas sp.]
MENNIISIIQDKGISLVLSGGGFRGAFHLGVLAFLDDNNIKINAISGTSIGALIACSYASGVKPTKILEIFESNEFKKMVSFNFSFKSFLKITIDKKIMNKLFLKENIEDLNIPVYLTISSISDSYVIYQNKGKVIDEILKSISLFPIFETVKEGSKIYADGGIFDNLPLKPLKKYAFNILSVNLHPNKKLKSLSFFSKIKKILFLVWYSNIIDSIDNSDYYITNDNLTKFNILKQNNNIELFNLGYSSAKKKFPN